MSNKNVIKWVENKPNILFVENEAALKNTLTFYCPGCEMEHTVLVERDKDNSSSMTYQWCMKMDRPTIFPCFRFEMGKKKCHLIVMNGQIKYFSDCTHPLKGRLIDMIPVEKW